MCYILLYLLAFIVFCSFLADLLIYTELPERLNKSQCRCNALRPNQTGRVVNGTKVFDPSYLPWSAALILRYRGLYYSFCSGTGKCGQLWLPCKALPYKCH